MRLITYQERIHMYSKAYDLHLGKEGIDMLDMGSNATMKDVERHVYERYKTYPSHMWKDSYVFVARDALRLIYKVKDVEPVVDDPYCFELTLSGPIQSRDEKTFFSVILKISNYQTYPCPFVSDDNFANFFEEGVVIEDLFKNQLYHDLTDLYQELGDPPYIAERRAYAMVFADEQKRRDDNVE